MAEEDTIVDINIDATPDKRKIGEEEWSEHAEALAQEWADDAAKASNAHNKCGLSYKKKHHMVGLPAILIPICMSPISATFADKDGIQYANMIGFLVSGCLSATHAFYGFDIKHQRHMDYSARYGDVCSDVKYELVKSRRFRISPDEFLMKIQMKMDSLAGSAPDL